MPLFAPFLTSCLDQGGDCAGNKTNEKPGKLGGIVFKSEINHSRKSHHAQQSAHSNWQEKT